MSSLPPDGKTAPITKPVGGLLALESNDELALGSVDDYTDELELGAAEDEEEDSEYGSGAVLSLSFGAQTTQLSVGQSNDDLGTGAWDIGDLSNMQELVVQETKGDFGGSGDPEDNHRYDVFVMEEEFDADAAVVTAVWEGPKGEHVLGTQVRSSSTQQQMLPYWIVGAMLAAVGLAVVVGIVLVVMISLAMGPDREIVPLDPTKLPPIEIQRTEIQEQTADEILEEVLGDEK